MAMRLAEYFQTDIVNADARQVFAEMSVGTARPTAEDCRRVPHHLAGHRSIHQAYDAAVFAEEARNRLEELFRHRNLVFLCGGSGLYIRALLDGLDDIPDVDESLRLVIGDEFRSRGLEWLQDEVKKADPVLYSRTDIMNPRRLLRALEVYRQTGMPLSSFQLQNRPVLPYRIIRIALHRPRTGLYEEIDRRTDRMLSSGLWEEAAGLFPYRHLQALQTVGYREIFDCLEDKTDRTEAVRLIKRNTRHYAKRQITWFRQDTRIRWFDWNDAASVRNHIVEQTGSQSGG